MVLESTVREGKMPKPGFSPSLPLEYDIDGPYASNQVGPFNSQNTFLHRDVLPYYMVLPHAGRMDDIWASYMVQKQFTNSVVYNRATVYQDRNEQDLVTNLEKEVIGYRNTLDFIEGRYQLEEDVQKSYDIYNRFMLSLSEVTV